MIHLSAVIARPHNSQECKTLYHAAHWSGDNSPARFGAQELEQKLVSNTPEGREMRETYAEVFFLINNAVHRSYDFKDPLGLARQQAEEKLRSAILMAESCAARVDAARRPLNAVTEAERQQILADEKLAQARAEMAAVESEEAALLEARKANVAHDKAPETSAAAPSAPSAAQQLPTIESPASTPKARQATRASKVAAA